MGNKNFLISFVIFTILELLLAISLYYVTKNDIKTYTAEYAKDFNAHIKLSTLNLNEKSAIFYKTLFDNQDTIDLMYQASQTKDKDRLKAIRAKLYKLYAKDYRYLKQSNVRQLHFHLPNAVSFLRFHRPSKYGDSLVGIRADLERVNKTHEVLSAFEEGRIFNGFRNIFPIFKDQEFVGTVEISYLFSALQSELLFVDPSSYLFMIKSKEVNKKLFNSEKYRYKTSEFSRYDYDIATLRDNMKLSLHDLYKINKAISSDVEKRLNEGKLFSINYSDKDIFDSKEIIISFSPVTNIHNECVAYIVHYDFADFLEIILEKSRIIFISMSVVLLLIAFIVFMLLYSNQKKHERVQYRANHDSLTGAYNRHGVHDIVNYKIKECYRHKRDLGVIFFDIDFFKKVNDTYGHDVGDDVLQAIANIINLNIRTVDIFARWGGEEFIIFLPEASLKDTINIAEKLRQAIQDNNFESAGNITCSFGVTVWNPNDTIKSMLKRSDEFLYMAKTRGRNQVVSDLD